MWDVLATGNNFACIIVYFFSSVVRISVFERLPVAHCYLLSMRWFSLEEERVMQQSSISISLSFENQGINPVGEYTLVQ